MYLFFCALGSGVDRWHTYIHTNIHSMLLLQRISWVNHKPNLATRRENLPRRMHHMYSFGIISVAVSTAKGVECRYLHVIVSILYLAFTEAEAATDVDAKVEAATDVEAKVEEEKACSSCMCCELLNRGVDRYVYASANRGVDRCARCAVKTLCTFRKPSVESAARWRSATRRRFASRATRKGQFAQKCSEVGQWSVSRNLTNTNNSRFGWIADALRMASSLLSKSKLSIAA
jgi:hypothetical protein